MLSKAQLLAWRDAHFPELQLNNLWSRSRLVDAVTSFLNTPQLFLFFYSPQVPIGPACGTELCGLNFAAPLLNRSWLNANASDYQFAGWGWSDTGDPAFAVLNEDTQYIANATATVVPFNPFSSASAPPNADAAATLRVQAGTAPLGGFPLVSAPGIGAYPSETDPGVWLSPSSGLGAQEVQPAVRRAVTLNRAGRYGQIATAEELAWCLASLKEVLLRADYVTTAEGGNSTGGNATQTQAVGELVRLDDVLFAAPVVA
jgi:hypothetical protein